MVEFLGYANVEEELRKLQEESEQGKTISRPIFANTV